MVLSGGIYYMALGRSCPGKAKENCRWAMRLPGYWEMQFSEGGGSIKGGKMSLAVAESEEEMEKSLLGCPLQPRHVAASAWEVKS